MDHKALMQKLIHALPVPMQLYSSEGLLLHSFNDHNFFPNPAHFLMQPYIGSKYSVCYLVSPDYLICGYVQLETSNEYLILGPVSPYELSAAPADNLLEAMQLSLKKKDELLRWFHYLPRMSAANFRSFIDFINAFVNPNRKEDPVHITYQVPFIELKDTKDHLPEISITMAVEQQMMKLIEYGKVHEFETYFNSLSSYPGVDLAQLAPTSLRSIKNTFISSVAVSSRTAVAGGLDYTTAISLSDYYISKVEKLHLYTDVYELLRSMLIDFAKRVSLCTHPTTDSATINAIYKDIQQHLYEKNSVKDIALRLSMEPT